MVIGVCVCVCVFALGLIPHWRCCRGNLRYRHLARKTKTKELGKPVSGPQSVPARAGSSGRWSGDVGTKLDTSPYSSLGASCEGLGSSYHSSGSSGYDVYSDYSSLPTGQYTPNLGGKEYDM